MTDFLKINGIAIPVMDGSAAFDFEEHGDRQRVMDGSLRTTRTAIKRRWKFETPVLDPETALMVAGLLTGSGHHFPFDADAFDIKGFGPLDPAATQVFTIRTGLQDDKATQRAELGLKYGGVVAVETGTTNLLSQNVRTGTDSGGNTTGFTEVDGPHTVFASTFLVSPNPLAWQGLKVLRVQTAVNGVGVRGGILTDGIAASATTSYTGSVYVSHAGVSPAGAIRMFIRDVANGIDGPVQTLANPGEPFQSKWTRLSSSVTTGALATTLEIHILEDVADTAVNFYADGFQIEQQSGPTSWVDGVRANGELKMDVQSFTSSGRTVPEDVRIAQDITVMCWVNRLSDGHFPTTTQIRHIWTITQDLGTGGALKHRGHVLGLSLNVINGGASGSSRVYAGGDDTGIDGAPDSSVTAEFLQGAAIGLNAWQHIAVVVRRNSVFGSDANRLKIYVDGSLVAQDPWTSGAKLLPNFSKTKALYIGTDPQEAATFGAYPSGAVVDDLVIVPYAMTAAGIAAVAAAGRAFSDLPRLDAEGAGIVTPDPRVTVIAELPTGEFIQAVTSGHVQNNRTVEFTLTEI